MKRPFFAVALTSLVMLAGCSSGGSNALSGTGAAPVAAVAVESACDQPDSGQAACTAILRTDVGLSTLAFMSQSGGLHTEAATITRGYTPSDLRAAYGVGSGGSGQTVAIVDAYDDPKAESDLAVYRAQFGLPVCSTANGCFTKIAQDGSKNYPAASPGWAGEISLDLDMASAICPSCRIMLVEAKSAYFNDLAAAVNRAASLHVAAISNSYGGPEFSSEAGYDSSFNHPGIVITASSGDSGYGVDYPAASRYVVAVGGSQLVRSGGARGFTESVWSGSASGCSAYESKPSWQHDGGCSKRTVNDVAFVASPSTPVAVYQSYCGGSVCGWVLYGGTSVGAPAVAAMYAVAGNGAGLSAAQSIYQAKPSSINDITSGTNGRCTTTYLCSGIVGYDGPSGIGSPAGTAAL